MNDAEREIYRAIDGYRNRHDEALIREHYPNWEEMFTKHNLTVLGCEGERRKPDGITWLAAPDDGYKGLRVMYPAIVQYRKDGSYLVKRAGWLIRK